MRIVMPDLPDVLFNARHSNLLKVKAMPEGLRCRTFLASRACIYLRIGKTELVNNFHARAVLYPARPALRQHNIKQ
jgi:hypothetical protein